MIYGENLRIVNNVQSAAKYTCNSFVYYYKNMNGDDINEIYKHTDTI